MTPQAQAAVMREQAQASAKQRFFPQERQAHCD